MSFEGMSSKSAHSESDWTGLPDPARSTYDLSEFLPYEGHRFLQAVYRCVLKRGIEPQSSQSLIAGLYSGRCTKEEIVWNVATSGEARTKAVRVSGLARANVRYRLFRIPGIGWCLRWLALILNLPGIEQELRRNHAAIRLLEVEVQQGMKKQVADVDASIRDLRVGKADRIDLAGMDRALSEMADQISILRVSLSGLDSLEGHSNASQFDESAILEHLALLSRELRQLKEQVARKADVLLFADLSRRLSRKEPIDLGDGRRPGVLDFKASAGSQTR